MALKQILAFAHEVAFEHEVALEQELERGNGS